MTDNQMLSREEILTEFFAGHASPTASDWKALIRAHPEHAVELADAHLILQFAASVGDEAIEPMDEQAISRTLAPVLDRLAIGRGRETSSVEASLSTLRGSRLRELSSAVGLNEHLSLLNGVLSGRTQAPQTILKRLAERLNVVPSQLALVFARRFESAGQPAFKSTDQKPTAQWHPTPWAEAVRAEGLPKEYEEELLALTDHDDSV